MAVAIPRLRYFFGEDPTPGGIDIAATAYAHVSEHDLITDLQSLSLRLRLARGASNRNVITILKSSFLTDINENLRYGLRSRRSLCWLSCCFAQG